MLEKLHLCCILFDLALCIQKIQISYTSNNVYNFLYFYVQNAIKNLKNIFKYLKKIQFLIINLKNDISIILNSTTGASNLDPTVRRRTYKHQSN